MGAAARRSRAAADAAIAPDEPARRLTLWIDEVAIRAAVAPAVVRRRAAP